MRFFYSKYHKYFFATLNWVVLMFLIFFWNFLHSVEFFWPGLFFENRIEDNELYLVLWTSPKSFSINKKTHKYSIYWKNRHISNTILIFNIDSKSRLVQQKKNCYNLSKGFTFIFMSRLNFLSSINNKKLIQKALRYKFVSTVLLFKRGNNKNDCISI